MAAEKCLYAYDYVDLKDREYVKKHARKRNLGDIMGKHRYRSRPSTANVVNSLVSLDFPETRAINTTTAGRIIADQRQQIRNTFQKTQWKETLNGWSQPSTSMDEIMQTTVDAEQQQRPHTSASVSIPDGSTQLPMSPLTLRPFSTGAVRRPSRKPPQASGFMWVRMKRNGSAAGSNVQFKRITEEIRLQWEEEDQKERQDHRKEKSQSPRRYDAFAGQWLSFAAGGMDSKGTGEGEDEAKPASGGVVEAFTGETNLEYYNIEGKVGADVANQLRIGNKIRIGVNGAVQSDSLRVRKWRKEVERAESVASDDSFTSTHAELFKLNGRTFKENKSTDSPPIVPLCWDDQLRKADVKVLEAKDKQAPAQKPDSSERHPVVFEKLIKDDARPKRGPKLETYRLSHRTKGKRNLDGTESLGNRITVITVDEIDEDRESLCSLDYDEILQRSLGEIGQPPDEGAPALLRHADDTSRSPDRVVPSPCSEGSASEPRTAPSPRVKRSTPHVSPRHSAGTREAGLVARTVTPKPRTVPLTSPVPSSPSIVSGRPRTGSQTSQRAQSSSSKGRYSFSQTPTPRNLNSPHPNLVKPGQLPRTGVSSINPGVQEGEHEYIQISQPILPGSERTQSQMDNLAAIDRVGERNDKEDSESLGRNPSIASLDSMDSMNVEGDQTGSRLPESVMEPPCGCSPEAKRAVSTALSLGSLDCAQIINIPTADMNTSLSDLNSVSDMDLPASYLSFRGSLSSDVEAAVAADLVPAGIGEGERHQHDLLPSSEISGKQVCTASRSSASSASSQCLPTSRRRKEELGYIINKVDGLELAPTDNEKAERHRTASSAKKPHRTVTFAEELQTPSVPNCTPESTPRDPTDVDSERGDLDMDEKDLRTRSPQPSDLAAEELGALRARIKLDLVEAQQTTQQDLNAIQAHRHQGKT